MPTERYLGPVQRRVLEYVAEHPGSTKADVIRAVRPGGNLRTGYLSIGRAYVSGYLDVDKSRRLHGAQRLFLSSLGKQALAAQLR